MRTGPADRSSGPVVSPSYFADQPQEQRGGSENGSQTPGRVANSAFA
jgi:hypothetical protein